MMSILAMSVADAGEAAGTAASTSGEATLDAWRGFTRGSWTRAVDVREFVQRNYAPYEGGPEFLAAATPRTKALWAKVRDLLAQERAQGGLLDVETAVSASILSHGPGYIDRESEQVVGLQTDAPLKRGIYLYGGIRTVENALADHGKALEPTLAKMFKARRPPG